MTSRRVVRTSRLSSVLSVVVVSTVLLVVVAVPGQPGQAVTQMRMSGLVLPLTEASVAIVSADINIRLGERGTATIHTQYEMRSYSETPTTLRIAVPIYTAHQPAAAIKFDGVSLQYSYLHWEDLAEPYLEKWVEKGWQLLGATDPELKAQLEALDPATDEVSRETRDALDAHVEVHSDRYGDQAKHWTDNVWRFLVLRDLYDFGRDLSLSDVRRAMRFLDPEYSAENYDLDRLLLEQWGLNVRLMRNPYDGRLYEQRGYGWVSTSHEMHVLQFDIALLPEKSHRLAIFYRQGVGFDNRHLTHLRSRQFCFVTNNAHKWSDWDSIHWTIRWPEGTKRISFGSPSPHNSTYWREGGYHNASYSTKLLDENLFIGWVR